MKSIHKKDCQRDFLRNFEQLLGSRSSWEVWADFVSMFAQTERDTYKRSLRRPVVGRVVYIHPKGHYPTISFGMCRLYLHREHTDKSIDRPPSMACGHIALDKLGAHISRYRATEIDKYAVKTASHNFPDIIQLGDAFQVRDESFLEDDFHGL